MQQAKETAQDHDVRPRRRKHGGSKDRKNRVFADDAQPQNETIEDDEPRKVRAPNSYVKVPFTLRSGMADFMFRKTYLLVDLLQAQSINS